MDFGPYEAFLSSDVPEMVDQQKSLVISTYLLYLARNITMLAVNLCILGPPIYAIPVDVLPALTHRPYNSLVLVAPSGWS
jgi:hypothetical protein